MVLLRRLQSSIQLVLLKLKIGNLRYRMPFSPSFHLLYERLDHIINVEYCVVLEISHSLPYYLLKLCSVS